MLRYADLIIHPNGVFEVCRESLLQVLIFYTYIFGLFKICFISEGWSVVWDFIDGTCLNGLFMLDIFLNFFTPFWKGQKLIIQFSRIGTNYLKFNFWVDLLSVFPFDIFFHEEVQT